MALRFKVFLINMDQDTQRLAKASRLLAGLNLPFERIAGVDLSDPASSQYMSSYSEQQNKRKFHKQMNLGEIGCYLSHKLAWQKIMEQKLDFAIILEDDFELPDDALVSAIDEILSLQQNWDYIKLYGRLKRNRKLTSIQQMDRFELVSFNKLPIGTVAQAVSFNGAQKLQKTSNTISRPVDVDLKYVWEKDLNAFGLVPFPVQHDDLQDSIIDSMGKRKGVKTNPWVKLKNQISFAINNALFNWRNKAGI